MSSYYSYIISILIRIDYVEISKVLIRAFISLTVRTNFPADLPEFLGNLIW